MLSNNCCSTFEDALMEARVGRYQELQCPGTATALVYCSAVRLYTMSTSLSSASCPCPHRTWQGGMRTRIPINVQGPRHETIAAEGSHGADCFRHGRVGYRQLHSTTVRLSAQLLRNWLRSGRSSGHPHHRSWHERPAATAHSMTASRTLQLTNLHRRTSSINAGMVTIGGR